MKGHRTGKHGLRRGTAALLAFLLIAAAGFASAGVHYDEGSQSYVDEHGQPVKDYWDEEAGVYIDEDGAAHEITDADQEAPAGEGGMEVISGENPIEDPSESSSGEGLTQEEWQARMQAAIERNGGTTMTYYMGPEKDPVPVTVIYMGLARSMIQCRGRELLVNTCDLIWTTEAPEDKVLAVVNANRVGYANLRAKTSAKSFIMDHCLTSRVVRVLSYGKNWCKVDYNGMRGFVQTAALTFHPVMMRTYKTAQISVNGRVSGKNLVNVRANPNNKSRSLGEYRMGTPLTVLEIGDKWCKVEVEGWHCYILTKFVKLDEEPAAALSASR